MQAQPHSGYYADILESPEATPAAAESQSQQNTEVQKGTSTQEKARVVFGSRLAGSRYEGAAHTPENKWQTINGVPIPPRPAEPDNCCMSGCVHCVWDDYRDAVEDWASRLKAAHAKAGAAGKGKHITSGKLPAKGRPEVNSASVSMDDDGGGSETNWDVGVTGGDADGDESLPDLFGGIPVGIREFMKTEKRLKEEHEREKKMGSLPPESRTQAQAQAS